MKTQSLGGIGPCAVLHITHNRATGIVEMHTDLVPPARFKLQFDE